MRLSSRVQVSDRIPEIFLAGNDLQTHWYPHKQKKWVSTLCSWLISVMKFTFPFLTLEKAGLNFVIQVFSKRVLKYFAYFINHVFIYCRYNSMVGKINHTSDMSPPSITQKNMTGHNTAPTLGKSSLEVLYTWVLNLNITYFIILSRMMYKCSYEFFSLVKWACIIYKYIKYVTDFVRVGSRFSSSFCKMFNTGRKRTKCGMFAIWHFGCPLKVSRD